MAVPKKRRVVSRLINRRVLGLKYKNLSKLYLSKVAFQAMNNFLLISSRFSKKLKFNQLKGKALNDKNKNGFLNNDVLKYMRRKKKKFPWLSRNLVFRIKRSKLKFRKISSGQFFFFKKECFNIKVRKIDILIRKSYLELTKPIGYKYIQLGLIPPKEQGLLFLKNDLISKFSIFGFDMPLIDKANLFFRGVLVENIKFMTSPFTWGAYKYRMFMNTAQVPKFFNNMPLGSGLNNLMEGNRFRTFLNFPKNLKKPSGPLFKDVWALAKADPNEGYWIYCLWLRAVKTWKRKFRFPFYYYVDRSPFGRKLFGRVLLSNLDTHTNNLNSFTLSIARKNKYPLWSSFRAYHINWNLDKDKHTWIEKHRLGLGRPFTSYLSLPLGDTRDFREFDIYTGRRANRKKNHKELFFWKSFSMVKFSELLKKVPFKKYVVKNNWYPTFNTEILKPKKYAFFNKITNVKVTTPIFLSMKSLYRGFGFFSYRVLLLSSFYLKNILIKAYRDTSDYIFVVILEDFFFWLPYYNFKWKYIPLSPHKTLTTKESDMNNYNLNFEFFQKKRNPSLKRILLKKKTDSNLELKPYVKCRLYMRELGFLIVYIFLILFSKLVDFYFFLKKKIKIEKEKLKVKIKKIKKKIKKNIKNKIGKVISFFKKNK
jgi:hypothetical protein